MLVIAFLQWWYGPGWLNAAIRLRLRMRGTYQNLSVPILLRTLFEPWRRIISYSEGSLSQRFRAVIDNLVSRSVGLVIRLTVLITAGVLLLGYVLVGGLLLAAWPLMPLVGMSFIVAGFL